MWTRWLAAIATIWAGGYVAGYLALVHHDGNSPAWWYVGLIAVAMVVSIAVAVGWLSRPALIAGASAFGVAAVLGLLTIGILLLPAIACLIVGAVRLTPAAPVATDSR